MKRISHHIYFSSIILLALVTLTSGCPQTVNVNTKTITLPGNVPLELLWIPPGTFLMGSPDDEQDSLADERPQHEVTISEGFWMGKYQITQEQWEVIMGENPSSNHFKGESRPMENVSWYDITELGGYLHYLNTIYPEYTFRLPSEAEWEYAYRAGTTTRFYWGDDPDYIEIDDYAWYGDNASEMTHDVGIKLPNAWGLYDMAGNVWEWCEDDWHDNYRGAPNDGSARVDHQRSQQRVLRGGTWLAHPEYCRAATRYSSNSDSIFSLIGFRIVCTVN